jgi:hypothetical protein
MGCGDRAEVGNDERGGIHATAEPVCWAGAGKKAEKSSDSEARLRENIKTFQKAARTTLNPGYDLLHIKIGFLQFRYFQAITTCK